MTHRAESGVGQHENTKQGSSTNLRHLRKPVELRMLLRPILLQVVRYSEYISDRDTEPSGVASKCAFSLMGEEKDDQDGPTNTQNKPDGQRTFSPLQSEFLPVEFHNPSWWLIGLN